MSSSSSSAPVRGLFGAAAFAELAKCPRNWSSLALLLHASPCVPGAQPAAQAKAVRRDCPAGRPSRQQSRPRSLRSRLARIVLPLEFRTGAPENAFVGEKSVSDYKAKLFMHFSTNEMHVQC